jgi:thioredoxin reductase
MPPPIRPNLDLSPARVFDVIIVGAGPAGLAAALALSRVNRTVVIFTSSKYRNEKAVRAHSILSRDHTPPEEIRRIGREQIEVYGTTQFVESAVVKARNMDHLALFEVDDAHGNTWQSRKVILATGVEDVMMDINGYEACWGSDIWQCLVCDGLERNDRAAGVLGPINPGSLLNIFTMLSFGCPQVTIFSNGPISQYDKVAWSTIAIAKTRGVDVDERNIQRLIRLEDEKGIDIVFEDGSQRRVGFLAVKPICRLSATNIATDLCVTITNDPKAGPMFLVNQPMNETNIPGVFSAGDASVNTKQFSIAMANGGLVGAAVNFQLCMDSIEIAKKQLQSNSGI